jgi:hypothetical protein
MKPSCTDRLSSLPVSVDISPSRAATFDRNHVRTTGEFEFPANALWGFDAKPGARISCVNGLVWVTQSGDGADHVLAQGESFTVFPRGRVVIQALSDARVHIA